ncbi:manganese/zinc/iron transport system permease protein [Natranaerovirga hydrolytica]|uniref:Manganese/zinc/iron transport system permease protein n=1 Tax=Natranaerovirga hydrolytica TaxID=680378 RepID=A0A4R1MZ66_9FIRM|nr:iron chelate uptake ABC transporter family permease subunit [Natranaerovirga hydrolytica]TCK98617.1 manganese/zinc/iron transport system permease protein [Natranaerovirga hydrolytica]
MGWLSNYFLNYTVMVVGMGSCIFGIISGVLGSFAVLRKQSLIGDAISHATLPGICIAFIITGVKSTPILLLGALLSGIVGVVIVMYIYNHTKIKYDSCLAMVLSVFFGLGLVLLTYIQKIPNANQAGLERFLFGQAATLLKSDVIFMLIMALLVMLMVMVFWKEFKVFVFDQAFAASMGFSTRGLDMILTSLLVIAIVLGLQTVGVVLMSAMLIAPGVAARHWTNHLWKMVIISAVFSTLSGILGTVLSTLITKMPTGPIIVIIMSIIAFVSVLFAPYKGIVWKKVRCFKNKKHYSMQKNKRFLEGGI